MSCSVFIRKNRFQQIGKSLSFLISKIFLGNCHYIYPKIISPVTKEDAIARASSQRCYTFITCVIIILLQILKYLIDLWTPFSKKIGKMNPGRFLKIFFTLSDKKVLFFLSFQTINKAVRKLNAPANNKACARFCTLF